MRVLEDVGEIATEEGTVNLEKDTQASFLVLRPEIQKLSFLAISIVYLMITFEFLTLS